MNQNENANYVPVFNLRMAQQLLKLGYTIKNIEINRFNPKQQIYFFEKENNIEGTIEGIVKWLKKQKRNERKNN